MGLIAHRSVHVERSSVDGDEGLLEQSIVDERQAYDRALQFVIGHTADAIDGAYVRDLVQFLSQNLGVAYTVCSIVSREADGLMETIAVCHGDQLLDDVSYGLGGAPCEPVIGGAPLVVEHDVQAAYPTCQLIKDLGAESYAAVPLWAADGSVLGLIAALDTVPLANPDFVIRILQLVSTRAGAEVERIRGVNDLRFEQKRSADFASVSSDWYWETDENLRFTYLSERFAEVTGVQPEALIGKTREEIGAPGANPEQYQRLLKTLHDHKPFKDFVHHRDHASGRRVYISISGKPVFEEDGDFIGYRGSGRDVTAHVVQSRELKRLADQAETDNRMILRVMNGIPALIGYIDKDQRYVFGNWAYSDWFGEDYQSLAGRAASDVHRGSSYARLQALLERGLAGETVELDLKLIRQDEKRIEIEGVIEPDKDEQDNVQGVYIFAKDVTENRATYRALHEAEIVARRSDRAKSQFLANMSHELRSPLNSIIGFSEVMSGEHFGSMDNPKYLEYAEGIQTASRHLLAVISDILDLSKVEAGAFDLDDEELSVDRLIEGSMTLVRPLAAARNQKIVVEADPDSVPVVADERLMRQVLVNLLTNAIKFSPRNSAITIRERQSDEAGLQLTVIDHGIGIPSDQRDRIFEPFGQVRNDAMVAHEGIGLGLSLSRRIVEMHGGRLEVDSVEGDGTSASLFLPVERCLRRDDDIQQASA